MDGFSNYNCLLLEKPYYAIYWLEIYPVDSIIHPSYNWDLTWF